MSQIFQLFRKTASRVYKRKNGTEELRPLQETDNPNSSNCYSFHQACSVGDTQAVRWYLENKKEEVNKQDKHGLLPIHYAIVKNNIAMVNTLIRGGADVNLLAVLSEGIDASAIHIASKFDRGECMKVLLKHGGYANIRNIFGQAPLHASAREKCLEVVKVLIEDGRANANITDNYGVTPLHLVASRGKDDKRRHVTKILLESGADPFSEDNEGNTVFHEAAENGVDDVLETLFQYRNSEKRGEYSRITDVLNKQRKDGYNCLHLAVENGHEKVIQMCIDHNVDLNCKTVCGDAPLHLACTKGHLNVCKMLVDNGADLEVTDRSDKFAIHRAASRGHLDCLAYLLEKGTEVDVFQGCGPALLSASCNRKSEAVKFLLEAGASVTMRNSMMDTCLHLAVRNGDVETVDVLLEKCGKELLELKDRNENTALHLAAKNGCPEVLKILLSHKPNLRAKDHKGKCPIHIASEYGNLECTKLLIEADKCTVHVADFMWRTPLHLANSSSIGKGSSIVAKVLLENGADPNARDDRRWTPLLYVAFGGCPCSTAMLVEAGAKVNEWDKNKMTALHIAASQNNSGAVKKLLEFGADPSILNSECQSCMDIALKNRYHDVCMEIVSCEKWREAVSSTATMEHCLTLSPEVAKVILDKCVEYSGREIDKDYKVTYHFDLLDPDPDSHDAYYGPMVMKMARRNELLTHPLTKKLLAVTWKRGVRYIYYPSMLVIAFVLVATTDFMVFNKSILKDCLDELASNYSEKNIPSEFYYDERFCADKVKYSHTRMFLCRSGIFLYFVIYLLKEMKELYEQRFEYFLEISNYMDVSVSILFLMFVQLPHGYPIPERRLKYGVLGIFGYYFLMFLWTRGFSRYGIYITMFLEVLATLLQVLTGFVVLFVGFAVTFYLCFIRAEDFEDIWNSVLKVLAMMLGELDYTGFREKADPLPDTTEIVAIFVFCVFCFTMSLVVNNLLIGLAVGDIESVQKNAEIKLLSLQVNQIVEARKKMIPWIQRKCYIKTFTETPNIKECDAEERRAKEYKERHEKRHKRKLFESLLNVASIEETKT